MFETLPLFEMPDPATRHGVQLDLLDAIALSRGLGSMPAPLVLFDDPSLTGQLVLGS